MIRYLFLIMLLLQGCVHSPEQVSDRPNEVLTMQQASRAQVSGQPSEVTTIQQTNGAQVLADLQRLYASAPVHCGSNSRPGFLCSGIIMRDADFSNAFHAWDPSPTQIAKGGVSFVYIRRDSKFVMYAGFTKGYILYPEMERPASKSQLMIECLFPMDGGTDYRKDHGCGPTPAYADSGRCHTLKPAVTTAPQWMAHFYKAGVSNRNHHQCAFNVADSANLHAGPTFNAALASMALLNSAHQNQSFNTWNEILVNVWGKGLGRSLPIKAFWYRTNGATNGLADAQKIQHDFLCSPTGGGVLLPLIRVMPPRIPAEDFIFQYNEADQSTGACT